MAIAIRLALLACLAAAALAAPANLTKATLIWQEDFNTLDEGRWKHLVTAWRGGNDEFQYYRNNRKNSYVENGILKIRPTPANEEMTDDQIRWGYIEEPGCNMEPCRSQGGQGDTVQPIFSARLFTQGTFSIAYGIVEFRAKMPRGDWIWPALWMMPESDVYGGWPRSGEIDVCESRGNKQLTASWGQSLGVDLTASTMHWGPDGNNNGFMKTHWERNGEDLSDDFHIYQLEWTQDHITFRFDNMDVGTISPPNGGFWELGGFGGNNIWAGHDRMAPFDQNFYLIINVAVGGRFFPDDAWNAPNGRPWDWNSGHPLQDFYEGQWNWGPTWDRPALEVDWVKVYAL